MTTSQLEDELDRATVEDLNTKPVGDASDDVVDNTLLAENERRTQANRLRRVFFRTVVGAMCFVLLASVGIMAAYMVSEWGDIDASVMIAWMSSAVVETIGLAYIIANYLFPAMKGNGSGN